MKKRKAQITVFIILGIVIIISIAGIIYLGKTKIDSDLAKKYFAQGEIKSQLDLVHESIIDCIDTTTQDALTLIGIQGGYYNAPQGSYHLGQISIPYYYKDNLLQMPKKSTITTELQDYTNNNLKYCFQNIKIQGFNLNYKNPKTTTKIEKNQVSFKIDLSITIEKQGNKIKFETSEHPVTHESKLYEIIEIADYITTSHNENPNMICINCVAQMAQQREVYVDMFKFDETTTQIIISENKTSEEPYIFEFLNEYPEEK